ncbi:hypothetical protein RHGRI_037333 [Rhododendron griersonianum]|uniref:Gnk2-homologous domain-containing protein n=1 Tax=Rhododendron griersonianum TaxID=479676 RepID=A0AAV6HUJ5_9ERIC|nr:hypothetical protein RHGRI_037333 [Rhododendron griersonianum]
MLPQPHPNKLIKGADPTFLFLECPKATLSTTSTYAPNSTYQTNLNTLLSVISSNSNASNGFYNFTAGSRPLDVAYGLFLCRGDISATACRHCIAYAAGDVVERCPRSKRAGIWYDECMLRYSNVSIFSTLDTTFRRILKNPQIVTNATSFREVLDEFIFLRTTSTTSTSSLVHHHASPPRLTTTIVYHHHWLQQHTTVRAPPRCTLQEMKRKRKTKQMSTLEVGGRGRGGRVVTNKKRQEEVVVEAREEVVGVGGGGGGRVLRNRKRQEEVVTVAWEDTQQVGGEGRGGRVRRNGKRQEEVVIEAREEVGGRGGGGRVLRKRKRPEEDVIEAREEVGEVGSGRRGRGVVRKSPEEVVVEAREEVVGVGGGGGGRVLRNRKRQEEVVTVAWEDTQQVGGEGRGGRVRRNGKRQEEVVIEAREEVGGGGGGRRVLRKRKRPKEDVIEAREEVGEVGSGRRGRGVVRKSPEEVEVEAREEVVGVGGGAGGRVLRNRKRQEEVVTVAWEDTQQVGGEGRGRRVRRNGKRQEEVVIEAREEVGGGGGGRRVLRKRKRPEEDVIEAREEVGEVGSGRRGRGVVRKSPEEVEVEAQEEVRHVGEVGGGGVGGRVVRKRNREEEVVIAAQEEGSLRAQLREDEAQSEALEEPPASEAEEDDDIQSEAAEDDDLQSEAAEDDDLQSEDEAEDDELQAESEEDEEESDVGDDEVDDGPPVGPQDQSLLKDFRNHVAAAIWGGGRVLRKRKRSEEDVIEAREEVGEVGSGRRGRGVVRKSPEEVVVEAREEVVGVGGGGGGRVLRNRKRQEEVVTVAMSLLKDFRNHVAAAIWGGTERKLLKIYNHSRLLRKWELPKTNRRFMEKVIASGLLPLVGITYKYSNYVLVSAFVERWHPETNNFHFRFGEMTITLDDVPYLIGVPVEGLAMHVEVHGKEDCVALLRRCLGVTKRNAKAAVCCGGVTFDWLWNTFHEVEDDATYDRVDYCVRAYLLYLFGTTLFVDKTGVRVNVSYLALLSDLTLVSTYAWGVGALGFLYRQLGQASRCHVKGMGGYTTLLETEQAIALESEESRHYDGGGTMNALYKTRSLNPLGSYIWFQFIRSPSDSNVDLISAVPTGQSFEAVRPCAVCSWGPPLAPLRGSRGSTAATYNVVYQYTDALWQNWRDHLLHEDKRVPVRAGVPWESHHDYLPWFTTVSHLRVSPNRREGQFILSVEERNAAALALLDGFLGGRTISTAPCDMWNTILQVWRILSGAEAGDPTTPAPTSSLVYVKTWLPLLQMPHLVGKGGLVLAAVVNGSPPELAPNPNTPAGTTIDALVGISARYGKVGVTRSVTMSHVR